MIPSLCPAVAPSGAERTFTRFEAEKPEQCRLETWSSLAAEEGTHILGDLRKIGEYWDIESGSKDTMDRPEFLNMISDSETIHPRCAHAE